MKEKIVIVGAGPVGCYVAQLLKASGYAPLLIEEHDGVGRPLHCTGLIGNRVFSRSPGLSISDASVINVINGATIHFNEKCFDIVRKSAAYVVDRDRFDKQLSQDLDIRFGNRFLGYEKNNGGYVIETDKNELYADIIIGADGANSSVRRELGAGYERDVKHHKGFQIKIKFRPQRKDFVEVYIKEASFFWIVPEAEDIVRIGVISDNPHHDLQEFLKTNKISGEILEKFGGLVSIGYCNQTLKDKIALVGGAACQVKPLTYGGVYFGLKAASILAACINSGRLDDYDHLWKNELGSEIRVGLKLKEAYDHLNLEELEKIFKFLESQKETIERVADFENHSRFFIEIIKNPSLYPQLGDLFRIFLKAIL